jgi:hypothetical protein
MNTTALYSSSSSTLYSSSSTPSSSYNLPHFPFFQLKMTQIDYRLSVSKRILGKPLNTYPTV